MVRVAGMHSGGLGSASAPILLLGGWLACGCQTPPPAALDAGADAGPPVPLDAGTDAPVATPDAGPEVPPLAFTLCPGQPDGGTFECATLEVPVDYEDPEGATIRLPVRRRPAPNRAERLGAIAWNPGGPGATTYPGLPPVGYTAAVGTLGRDVGDRFDLLSMDWRGVGSSTPAIECDVDRELAGAMASRFDLLEPMDLARTAAIYEGIIERCVAAHDRDLLARLGSRNAARDLDRLRAALGEERLNYWGFSYGTALGATYATMFPERVRAFVLDSISLPSPPVVTPEELASYEARLDEFFEWCSATPASCAFARGRTAAELDDAWRALVAELDRYPAVVDGETVSGNTVRSKSIGMRLGGRTAFPSMGTALANAEDGSYARLVSMPSMPETEADESTPFYAIRAADDGIYGLDAMGALDFLRTSYLPASDRLGAVYLGSALTALMWPVVPADGPALVGPTSAPPMLIIAATGDLATPYASAISLESSLANGSYLVTYEGTLHAPSSSIACPRDAALAFFLRPDEAPSVERCVGTEP